MCAFGFKGVDDWPAVWLNVCRFGTRIWLPVGQVELRAGCLIVPLRSTERGKVAIVARFDCAEIPCHT